MVKRQFVGMLLIVLNGIEMYKKVFVAVLLIMLLIVLNGIEISFPFLVSSL